MESRNDGIINLGRINNPGGAISGSGDAIVSAAPRRLPDAAPALPRAHTLRLLRTSSSFPLEQMVMINGSVLLMLFCVNAFSINTCRLNGGNSFSVSSSEMVMLT